MDSKLIDLLKKHRMEESKDCLADLGVKACEDILDISSDNLVHYLNLNEIGKNKFYKMRNEILSLPKKNQEKIINTPQPLPEPSPLENSQESFLLRQTNSNTCNINRNSTFELAQHQTINYGYASLDPNLYNRENTVNPIIEDQRRNYTQPQPAQVSQSSSIHQLVQPPYFTNQPQSIQGPPLSIQGQPLSIQGPPLSIQGQPLSIQGQLQSIQEPQSIQGDTQARNIQGNIHGITGSQMSIINMQTAVQSNVAQIQAGSLYAETQSAGMHPEQITEQRTQQQYTHREIISKKSLGNETTMTHHQSVMHCSACRQSICTENLSPGPSPARKAHSAQPNQISPQNLINLEDPQTPNNPLPQCHELSYFLSNAEDQRPLQPQIPSTQPQIYHAQTQKHDKQPQMHPIYANQPQMHPSQPQILPNQTQMHLNQPQMHPSQPQILPNQTQMHPNQPQILPNQTQKHLNQPQMHSNQPQMHPSQPQILPSQTQMHPNQSQMNPLFSQMHPNQPQIQKGAINNSRLRNEFYSDSPPHLHTTETSIFESPEDQIFLSEDALIDFKDDLYYTLDDETRGLALGFITKHMCGEKRQGVEADDSTLSKLFESMGVHYVPYHNMSRENIKYTIASNFSERDIERYSMFILVFSTHGDEDHLYDNNQKVFSIYQDILPLLKPNVCKHLEGKPKIILVQACRGDRRDSKVNLNEKECVRIDSLKPKSQIVTLETDFLIAYSCVRGYVAHRHIEEGSWFLEAFYKIYTEYGSTHNFRDLLILTNRYMLRKYSLKSESGTTLQPCQYETTFRKFLKIKPTDDNRVVTN